jgi:hypothetical protein
MIAVNLVTGAAMPLAHMLQHDVDGFVEHHRRVFDDLPPDVDVRTS